MDNKDKKKYSYDKEKKKEYFNNFKNNNKDKLNEVIKCECGGCYKYLTKSIHKNTIKHKYYILTKSHGQKETQ
jgi:hypothetical protein